MMVSTVARRATVVAVVVLGGCARTPDGTVFHGDWDAVPNRRWVGADYWANRLQDWRVTGGRLEAVGQGPLRTVHLLTRRVGSGSGDVAMTVTIGLPSIASDSAVGEGAGFLLGAGRGLDYRAASLIHHSPGPGAGLYGGIDRGGHLFLRDLGEGDVTLGRSEGGALPGDSIVLALEAHPQDGTYEITLSAAMPGAADSLPPLRVTGIPAERIEGNVALVADQATTTGPVWFAHWIVSGTKVESHPECRLGPVIGTQHTLSRGTLKLTAQFLPLGDDEPDSAALEVRDGRSWRQVATAAIVVPGFTATFGVAWDAERDTPFRVVYPIGDATHASYSEGMVRAEPVSKPEIVVAAFTGNHNVQNGGVDGGAFPWETGVWFPHADVVRHVQAHHPDFLFFSGDQVYEGASPTRADRTHPYEDYLYKWYLWYWAFGPLTAEIPAVTIPDDHDVYQGNIWGAGGIATPPGLSGAAAQDAGGYVLPAEWVNMVQRTQTSHLPDPVDPAPVAQGIGVYFTDLEYGGVSFAVLEDRKFKSAPAPLLPQADIWNGWPRARDFDAKTEGDPPGATLLGDRQLAFLNRWAADWSGGVWMKVALSQTFFATLATLPDTALTGAVIPSLPILGPDEYSEGERPTRDMDSDGWPRSGRDRAVRALRKGFAVHLAGDQHLGSTIQYGVDTWGDAGYALCVPSVANFWPRRWYPAEPGGRRDSQRPRYTGDYEDGFGNKLTVFAVSNPSRNDHEPTALHNRAPGYGIARFNRVTRTVSLAAWPRWADPERDAPYPGWPVTFAQRDGYGRQPAAYLPYLTVVGMRDPVVQVTEDATGEVTYTLRIAGDTVTLPVFAPGTYTVHVGEPGTPRMRVLNGLVSAPQVTDSMQVVFDPE
jgi:alkaline phosphatase D